MTPDQLKELRQTREERSLSAEKEGVEAFRVWESESLGLSLDVFGGTYILWVSKEAPSDKNLIAQALNIDVSNLIVKKRTIQTRDLKYQKMAKSPCGFWIQEKGLKFWVDPCTYHDVGLFLDQRISRNLISSWSKGKKVLNLFCYTGSFSVYAGAGGAREVHSLDMNENYLTWAKKNWEANSLGKTLSRWLSRDALEYLRSQTPQKYDMIILDPPTFSSGKKMRESWDVQRDHVWALKKCFQLLEPGGMVYFSTNFSHFKPDKSLVLSENFKELTKETRTFDFPKGGHRAFIFRDVKQ